MKNLDPNITWGKKTFKLTFMAWDYKETVETTVGGNCRAFDNLDSALSNVYDKLPRDEYDTSYIILKRGDGETLHCEDDDCRSEDWLRDMLVSAELVSVEEEK